MTNLNSFGVEELDQETSAQTNGGSWTKIVAYVVKEVIENWNEIEEGFASAYDPCTR